MNLKIVDLKPHFWRTFHERRVFIGGFEHIPHRVSIVTFEHVIVDWDMLLFIKMNFLFLYLTIFLFLLKSAKLPWKSLKNDEKLQKFNFIDNHFTSEMYYFLYLIKLIFEVALFEIILQTSAEIKDQQLKNKFHKCCIYRLPTLVKYCQIVRNLGQRPKGPVKAENVSHIIYDFKFQSTN